MRRGWILLLLAAGVGAQDFSEAELDRAIKELGWGEHAAVRRITAWGPRASRAVPALVGSWRMPGPDMERLVDDALRAIGPAAIPDVVKALASKDELVSGRAGDFLDACGKLPSAVPLDPGLEDVFVDLLDHKDPRARAAAARTLASGGAAVVPKLAALLGKGTPERRLAVALALSWMDPPPEDASGALVAATSDKDESVRIQALVAVGRLCSTEDQTVRCLIAALRDPADPVASMAVAQLARRGPGVTAAVMAAWEDETSAPLATEVLVRLGDGALQPVREALRSGDGKRKRRAAECLGRIAAIRDVAVEGALAQALGDPGADVRLAAAESLGITTPSVSARALDALLAAANDADAGVRAAAAAAALRAAPEDPKVVALLQAARQGTDPGMKLVAAAADARSLEECAAVARNAAAPAVARMVAAERSRAIAEPPGGAIAAFGGMVADRGLPVDVRAAAADAIAATAGRRLFELRNDPRERGTTPKGFRAAAEKGLAWLARTQQTRARQGDGRWKGEALLGNHDIGLTGLALLTFLAAGQTDRAPSTYATNVKEGVDWLLSRQTPEGLFREGKNHDHTLLEHAIATHALCELIGMTGDDRLRPQAQKAVDSCVAVRGRNGWRYVAGSAQSDTNVTTWMGVALSVASELGFDVDPEARWGACRWIELVTDPGFGTAGYDRPEGEASRPVGWRDRFPPEKTFAMTACGAVFRVFYGDDPSDPIIQQAMRACVLVPPKWNEEDGSIDMYYWYYGSLAMFHAGDRWWTTWAPALKRALLPNQQEDGSWKAVDVWQCYGGPIYSTTMCTLALLTPWRYPRGFADHSKRVAAYTAAIAALHEAEASPCERLRAAAVRALACCPGRR